jgi:putative ABC transport system permease protein
MLKSYLKIALRTLLRHKGYTFINVAGLAVGMAACLLIALLIRHELSYDRFHEQADRIYRLMWAAGDEIGSVRTPAFAAGQIGGFPEVAQFVRIFPTTEVIIHEGLPIEEEQFLYADASFFEVFTFPLLAGDSRTALAEPNTVVLSQTAAERYFGDQNPIGQTLTLRNGTTLQITGIAEDAPTNSHLQFGILASFHTLDDIERGFGYQSWTYLVLPDADARERLKERLDGITAPGMDRMVAELGFAFQGTHFYLQPLTEVRLHSAASGVIQPEGDVRYLYIFGAVGLFILLIAAVNYMNLATARSLQRAREVGVRKVLGAQRRQLAGQFIGEAVLVSLLAFVSALLLAELALPAFEMLSGQAFGLNALNELPFVIGLVGSAILIGIISGSYPALVLSRFVPAAVLKARAGGKTGRDVLRKVLIVFQFSVSIALIVGTIIVQTQLRYIQDRRLGYDTEQIVTLRIPDTGNPNTYDSGDGTANRIAMYKAELLRTAGVRQVAVASGLPLQVFSSQSDRNGEMTELHSIAADPDYLETMGMQLVAGRDFSEEIPTDLSNGILVNETAARVFGLEDKVGQQLDVQQLEITFLLRPNPVLLGIVRDFHTGSLHHPIQPTALSVLPNFLDTFVLRIDGENLAATVDALRETWRRLAPDYPFDLSFFDDVLQTQYEADRRLGQTFGFFAALAILIACLGLFGLAAYTAERRTKEIGIRKVLGATVSNLVLLLSKDFIRLVLIAFVVAVPVAWYAMSRWLQDFAYRIEIEPGIFLLAGALALVIALGTVSYQAVRAALADPVKSLRYE